VSAAEEVITEIVKAGGQGVSKQCDVSNWDDQVSLFELAMSTYGSVDIVVPNAGVGERGSFVSTKVVDGKPIKPSFKTIEINLIGVMYTAHLGLYYMKQKKIHGSLKSLVFLGSMASWQSIPGAPMYSASKHAILGFMRSLYIPCFQEGIRVAVIHPWFADTAILPTAVKVFLAGIPLTPIERVAGAIFYAASDPDMGTSGCPWVLPDNGYVFRLEKEQLKEGVYKMLDERVKMVSGAAQGVKYAFATVRDLGKIFGTQAVVLAVMLGGAGYLQGSEPVRDFVRYHAELCSERIGAAVANLFR